MSSENYYKKYWENDYVLSGHVSTPPHWSKKELKLYYEAIKEYVGTRVLDIGCGDGTFLKFLIETTSSVSYVGGLDISSFAIEKAKTIVSDANLIVGSAEDKLPFEDKTFDTIFMNDVIEHLLDVSATLTHINSLLIPKGKLIIITPDYNWLKKIIISAFFWEKFFYPTNPHIRFFTKKSMDSLLLKHGFKPVFNRWGLTWFGIMPQNSYFVYEKQ